MVCGITFHPSWYCKHAGVSFDRVFFYDHDYRVAADQKMRQILYDKFGIGEHNPKPRPVLGSDLLACGFLHSELLGCEVLYTKDLPPAVVCAKLDDEAAMSLRPPDLDAHPLWASVQKQIDCLMSKFGYVLPCVNLMGVQNIALDLRGERLLMDYYTNPDIASRLLDVSTALCLDVGARLRAISPCVSWGVASVTRQVLPDVYLTSNCSAEMISNETYEEFLLPYDIKLAEAFAPFGMHHCGATAEHVAQGYKKIPGLAFIEAGAGSDYRQIRQAFPGIPLNARYSPVKILSATYGEMKKEIEAIVANAGNTDNLSISCVGVDSTVSDEQVLHFLEICNSIE